MRLFKIFGRRSSGPVARERLQILLAHERTLAGKVDLIAVLQEEILAVLARHVSVERDKVRVTVDRGAAISTLEVDIEIPTPVGAAVAVGH